MTAPESPPRDSHHDTKHAAPHDGHGHKANIANEPDSIPTGPLVAWSVALLVVVVISSIGLRQINLRGTLDEMRAKSSAVSPGLTQREAGERQLTEYAAVDVKAGRYRIPVDEAMRMIVADPKLLKAIPDPNAAATPAATSAPASGPASTPAAGAASKPVR